MARNSFKYIFFAWAGLSLAACGGGGGPADPPTVMASAATQSLIATATIGPPQPASLRGNSFPAASGSTPNFTGSLPANGTVFPLDDTVLQFAPVTSPTGESVADYTHSLSGGTTLTLQGSQVINGTTRYVFGFKEPDLSVDVPGITGTSVTLSDGRKLDLVTTMLNYTLLGFWNLRPAATSGSTYWGIGFSGYQTPASSVPTAGTATYASGSGSFPGGVSGFAFSPSGSFTSNIDISGQASISVNFPTGAVAGSLTNMTALVEGDGPTPSAWNDVALSGTLSGATMQGATSVTSAPSNPLAMGSAAKGSFVGALFGPNGEEIGISWNLYDSAGNGKAAFGTIGATKQ